LPVDVLTGNWYVSDDEGGEEEEDKQLRAILDDMEII